jgi:mevalonate kinase
MTKSYRTFNSKVLLFGEYTLMMGSMALSIPFEKYTGQLYFENSKSKSDHYSVPYLMDYLNFLKNNGLNKTIDVERFENDINKGLIFETNIPISYGLGSSGAIVASIYDKYKIVNIEELSALQKIFSKMEAYYHGSSSGLDPLVSYIDKPILVNNERVPQITSLQENKYKETAAIFLMDTKTVGETQPLVNWFMERIKDPVFKKSISETLVLLNNKCIHNLLLGETDDLLKSVKQVSQFTLDNFSPMIPPHITSIWKEGLSTGAYSLKLCGSGGGGMMLGFTTNLQKAKKVLTNYNVQSIINI